MKYTAERKFEQNLARYVFVTILILNTYGIIHYIIYGGKFLNLVVVSCAWCFYSFLFYVAEVKQRFDKVILPLIASLLALLIFFWLNMGGIHTAVPYLFQLATLVAIVICKPNSRLPVACLFVFITIVLVAVEAYSYQIISVPTASAMKGVPVVYIISTFTIAYLAFHLKSKFDQERDMLHEQSVALVEKSQIIHQQNEAIM